MPAIAKGAKAQIVYDEESVFKTDPGAPDAKKLFIIRDGLSAKRNFIIDETLRNNRNPVEPDLGNLDIGGTVLVDLCETSHATLIKHGMGAVTTTGSVDPWEHVLKPGDLPVGLVLEKGYTDMGQYVKYNGCRIGAMTFRFPRQGHATLELELVGAKRTVSGTPYDATPTELAYRPYSQSMITLVEEGGSALGKGAECEFKVDNGFDGDVYPLGGGGERIEIPEGFSLITGKLTAWFDDIALYNKAINETESSLKIKLDKNLTPARSMEFFIPELKYEEETPPIEGPKGIMVNLGFRAFYDDSAEQAGLQITINNGLSAI